MGRPDIIFILIDDMGWTDLGCYGSSFYETPCLDRLARGSPHPTPTTSRPRTREEGRRRRRRLRERHDHLALGSGPVELAEADVLPA